MLNFLHNFHPQPILAALGPIHIYWYGFFMTLSIIIALAAALILARYYKIPQNTLIDLAFWLIIGLASGFILGSLFWLWVITGLAGKDRLFMKDANGKWLPKNPPT